jgi:hypothetical protein
MLSMKNYSGAQPKSVRSSVAISYSPSSYSRNFLNVALAVFVLTQFPQHRVYSVFSSTLCSLHFLFDIVFPLALPTLGISSPFIHESRWFSRTLIPIVAIHQLWLVRLRF